MSIQIIDSFPLKVFYVMIRDNRSMKLPPAETYEKEFTYMPWGMLIQRVLEIVQDEVPYGALVIDLMCGPGYLLGKIHEIRSDLRLKGMDVNDDFIKYARRKYNDLAFEVADVLSWNTGDKYDLVLCTGGMHHLPYEKQSLLIQKAADLLKTDGQCLFADPYIDDYSNETERKTAAATLGYEYLLTTIQNGATDDVIRATAELIHNDVLGEEFKTSLKKALPLFHESFKHVSTEKTWPSLDTEFGDYLIKAKTSR